MAIKIGHASKDENNKYANGKSGDQTGKEVCIRTWYAAGWNVVLRPKNKTLAEKSALACEKACANSNIGYDQNQRNTLYKYAKDVKFDLSKVAEKCECDCSSLMHVCAISGGANLTYGANGFFTGNMVNGFVKSGDYEKLAESKYLTSDTFLMRGDILVRESGHTAMVLENGNLTTTSNGETSSTYTLKDFIKEIQASIGAKVDGIAGPETLSKTITVSASKNSRHAVVRPLQKRLNALGYNCGTADGIAGAKFTLAVKEYQKANKCVADGEITAKNTTWKKLLNMA